MPSLQCELRDDGVVAEAITSFVAQKRSPGGATRFARSIWNWVDATVAAMEALNVWDVLDALQKHNGSASRETLADDLPGPGLDEAIADGVERGFFSDHGIKVRVTPEGAEAWDSQLFS
jgi:hypothetical protein